MGSDSRRICYLKSAQSFGATVMESLKDIHGMITRKYKMGVAHIFPTNDEVGDYSKSVFKPLIASNKISIGRYVKNVSGGTDTTALKNVNGAMLYLRGARLSQKVGDSAESTSSKTSGFSVDKVVFDEVDFMDTDVIEKYKGRMGMSPHKHEVYLGNPSHEDFGIDLIFKCVTPDTKILTADLRWKQASELCTGDKLVGFDEYHKKGSKTRRYDISTITGCGRVSLPCSKLTLDDGTSVTVSKKHKWLVSWNSNVTWKCTDKLKIGDKILSIGTWEEKDSYEYGWLGGVLDGEGCISLQTRSGGNQRLIYFTVAQNEGVVIEKTKFLLDKLNIPYSCNSHIDKRSDKKHVSLFIKGGMPVRLRLLGLTRPCRLLEKTDLYLKNVSVGNDGGCTKTPKITKIEDVGVKEVVALGTDKKTFIANGLLSHNSSDQRYWFRKCSCGHWTCAEKSFPQCVKIRPDGTGYVGCDKCGKEVHVWAGEGTGEWVPDFPDKSKYMHGYMASQLMTSFNDPAEILEDLVNPPYGNLGDFWRLRMGRPYSDKSEKLRKSDVLMCCGNDGLSTKHPGPCAMGVDVGKIKHVVIGMKMPKGRYEILRAIKIPEGREGWNQISDLALKYNVKSTVIDIRPYEDEARAYQTKHCGGSINPSVFLCEYSDTQVTDSAFNNNTGVVKAHRTGIFDQTHRLLSMGEIILPRQCPEIEEFARQCCNCARFEEKDKRKGTIVNRYRPTGDRQEHFRNALNYMILACSGHRVGTVSRYKVQTYAEVDNEYTRY